MLRKLLCRLFVIIGRYLFPAVNVWSDATGEPRVCWFADSERDLNIGTREYVEMLDET